MQIMEDFIDNLFFYREFYDDKISISLLKDPYETEETAIPI